MKIKYNTSMDILCKEILEAADGGWPKRQIFRLYRHNVLYGMIRKNRVRLIKETSFSRRVPQRIFYGKIYEQDNCTFIKGYFFLQLVDWGFIILWLTVFNVVHLLLGIESFDYLIFDLFILLLLCILAIPFTSFMSMICYIREEKYVRDFLLSLQNKFI